MERIAGDSLVAAVAERIRDLIAEGGLDAGDRLPTELELVDRLGVSRTVLREAVIGLQTVGLVTVKRGRGMYVGGHESVMNCARLVHASMAISSQDLAQFLELRSAIEHYAARRAADRAGPADVAQLRALCDRMCAEMEQGGEAPQEAMRTDFRFHLKLVELAGVELLGHVMEVVQEFVMEGMLRTWPVPAQYPVGRETHVAIVEAVDAGDPEAAQSAVRAHMDVLFSRLRQTDRPAERGHDADVAE